MQSYYNLIVHCDKKALTFPSEVEDKEYATAIPPTSDRPSVADAVFFRELQIIQTHFQVLKTHMFFVKKLPPEDYRQIVPHEAYKQIISLCAENSPAFSSHLDYFFNYASFLQLPFTPQKDPHSYSDYFFSDKMPVTKQYFHKLNVGEKNNRTAERYLWENFAAAQKTEKLLHIRECEHVLCTLHPAASPLVKNTLEHTTAEVIKYILENHPDKNNTIHYGGFATGYLKRDLDIIKELINLGYKKFKFFFVDRSYANLIGLANSTISLALADRVAVDLNYKAIFEFSNWIATHIENDKKSPVEIHLFADIKEALSYFKENKDKLTVLVGQDYWTKKGCAAENAAKYGTPDAHEDFVKLSKMALMKEGCFFELMKDDTKNEIYFQKGTTASLFPQTIIDTRRNTTSHSLLSLGLFTKVAANKPATASADTADEIDADSLLESVKALGI